MTDESIPKKLPLDEEYDLWRWNFRKRDWIAWRWNWQSPGWLQGLALYAQEEGITSLVVRRPGESGGAEEWKITRRRSAPELLQPIQK